jgi:hypothetical protein
MTEYDIVPSENLAIYKLLYNVEVGLRELIVEVLDGKCGPRWWKERLPPDVFGRYRDGRKYERSIRWCQLIPHHPVYYIEFPDLKKVIERSDNWRDGFQDICGRKEIFINTLSELEPIRNKIAHNRKATTGELLIVEGAYHKIVTAIGEKYFYELAARCTLAEGVAESLIHLQKEAQSAFKCCERCESLERPEVWDKIQSTWWFDSDYLGCEVGSITEYFETLSAYHDLPRSKGSGYKIEAWIKSRDIGQKYAKAMEEFSVLLKDVGGV